MDDGFRADVTAFAKMHRKPKPKRRPTIAQGPKGNVGAPTESSARRVAETKSNVKRAAPNPPQRASGSRVSRVEKRASDSNVVSPMQSSKIPVLKARTERKAPRTSPPRTEKRKQGDTGANSSPLRTPQGPSVADELWVSAKRALAAGGEAEERMRRVVDAISSSGSNMDGLPSDDRLMRLARMLWRDSEVADRARHLCMETLRVAEARLQASWAESAVQETWDGASKYLSGGGLSGKEDWVRAPKEKQLEALVEVTKSRRKLRSVGNGIATRRFAGDARDWTGGQQDRSERIRRLLGIDISIASQALQVQDDLIRSMRRWFATYKPRPKPPAAGTPRYRVSSPSSLGSFPFQEEEEGEEYSVAGVQRSKRSVSPSENMNFAGVERSKRSVSPSENMNFEGMERSKRSVSPSENIYFAGVEGSKIQQLKEEDEGLEKTLTSYGDDDDQEKLQPQNTTPHTYPTGGLAKITSELLRTHKEMTASHTLASVRTQAALEAALASSRLREAGGSLRPSAPIANLKLLASPMSFVRMGDEEEEEKESGILETPIQSSGRGLEKPIHSTGGGLEKPSHSTGGGSTKTTPIHSSGGGSPKRKPMQSSVDASRPQKTDHSSDDASRPQKTDHSSVGASPPQKTESLKRPDTPPTMAPLPAVTSSPLQRIVGSSREFTFTSLESGARHREPHITSMPSVPTSDAKPTPMAEEHTSLEDSSLVTRASSASRRRQTSTPLDQLLSSTISSPPSKHPPRPVRAPPPQPPPDLAAVLHSFELVQAATTTTTHRGRSDSVDSHSTAASYRTATNL